MLFDPFARLTTERKKFNLELKKNLAAAQGGKCMYCGRKPDLDLMDIDHKNPISKGGTNTKRNLQVLCRTCNTRKGARTDREFRRMYKDAGVPQTQTPPTKTILPRAFDETGKKVATARTKRRANARAKDTFGGLF